MHHGVRRDEAGPALRVPRDKPEGGAQDWLLPDEHSGPGLLHQGKHMGLYHHNDKNKKIILKMIILTENEYSDPIMLQVFIIVKA